MKAFLRYLVIVFLCTNFIGSTYAQKEHRKRARKAIKELKEGILVVLIPTYQKKIDTLNSLLRKDISKRKRKHLIEQLEKVRQDREEVPIRIKVSFNEYYDFSRVLFLDDTLGTYLKQDNYANNFLNKGNIMVSKENLFFIYKPSVMRTSNRIRLATTDKNFIPLEPPFPDDRIRTFSIPNSYTSQKKRSIESFRIELFNDRLWYFYNTADKKKWWHFFTREWKE